jgi:protein-tyrosine kinase
VESIRQAIELARGQPSPSVVADAVQPPPNLQIPKIPQIALDPKHLESKRIVAHRTTDPHGRYFDMLRTQVLQAMDKSGWQFLAVTSPTASCGKSVTACNLALSIARLSERSVLLVDLDLQKPRVADYLGIERKEGLFSVLEGRAGPADRMVQASIDRTQLLVLPGDVGKAGLAEWMASRNMTTVLQSIRRDFKSHVVIFDMPPMLLGDDVISILPQMDAVLLVAGVGNTTVADINECQKHLKSTPVVRIVVNKVTEINEGYYSYY